MKSNMYWKFSEVELDKKMYYGFFSSEKEQFECNWETFSNGYDCTMLTNEKKAEFELFQRNKIKSIDGIYGVEWIEVSATKERVTC